MHTFRYEAPLGPDVPEEVAGKIFLFQHNSDLSGSVKIAAAKPAQEESDMADVEFLDVPGAAIVEFVAEYVRRERISGLEDANPEDILGIEELPQV